MLRNEKNSGRYFAFACMGVLMIFFACIAGRFLVRQVVVKKLGISNALTAAIFFDAEELNRLPGQENEYGKTVKIDWQEKYPFAAEAGQGRSLREKYMDKAAAGEKKIEDYTGRFLLGRNQMAQMAEHYRDLLAWKLGINFADEDVFYLQNGYMTYYQKKVSKHDIQEIADSMADFQGWLRKQNISFLYVNAGSKVNPLDKQMTAYQTAVEFTNENGDEFEEALTQRGVAYMDMRQEMHKAGLDWYGSYYKYDHHWKTQTGMWAAGVIAEKLNRDYGFHYDKKYFQPENYIQDTYNWKGGQWKNLYTTLGKNCDGEPYTYFLPDFPTQFAVEVPTRGISRQGEYKDTLFEMDVMRKNRQFADDEEAARSRSAYYNTVWINDALGIFKNQLPVNNPQKILVLQDSFAWYLTSYLALDTAEIDVIHPMRFDGSIRRYIEEFQPDMVLVILCEKNIKAIDWTQHNTPFDFR